MTTFGTEKENLAVLKDDVEYLEKRHDLTVKVVRSDNEFNRSCVTTGLQRVIEPSAPRTPQQNGLAERSEPTSLMISRKRWSMWQHISVSGRRERT
jgi:hypothetical protein